MVAAAAKAAGVAFAACDASLDHARAPSTWLDDQMLAVKRLPLRLLAPAYPVELWMRQRDLTKDFRCQTPPSTGYLTGGAYIRPPFFHCAFRPLGSPSSESLPILRSKLSP